MLLESEVSSPPLVCDNRQEIDWFERASDTIFGELLLGAHDHVRAPGQAFQHIWASTPEVNRPSK
eukprot:COSAG06_NODE_61307_length_268_cov_0.609467_1_plen_65_part_01